MKPKRRSPPPFDDEDSAGCDALPARVEGMLAKRTRALEATSILAKRT